MVSTSLQAIPTADTQGCIEGMGSGEEANANDGGGGRWAAEDSGEVEQGEVGQRSAPSDKPEAIEQVPGELHFSSAENIINSGC